MFVLTSLPSVGTLTRDYRFDTATGRLLFASNSTWSVVYGYEKGEYFWRAVPVSNSSAPVYSTITVVATKYLEHYDGNAVGLVITY